MTNPDADTPASAPGSLEDAESRYPTWRLLLQYSAGVRVRIVLGGLLTFVGTLIALTQPLLAQLILAAVTFHRPVWPVLLILTSAVVLSALLSASGFYLLEYAGETVVLTVRSRLIRRILRLRVDVVDTIPPGELMSRLIADTIMLRQVTTQGLATATTAVISLIGALTLMGILDWLLLLVTLAAVASMAFTVRWSTRKIGSAAGEVQGAVGTIATLLDRCLGALRTVKAAGAEPEQAQALTSAASDAWRRGLRLARWQATSGTTAIFTMQVAFLTVLGVGGGRVASGAMSVGTLIAFMLFMLYLGYPINTLVGAFGQYQAGSAAAKRLQQLLSLPVEDTDEAMLERALVAGDVPAAGAHRRHRAAAAAAHPRRRAAATGGDPRGPAVANHPAAGEVPASGSWPATVDFQDVTFAYRPDGPLVHRGVTFRVPPGGTTAIVGPSGAGKSTVFGLLERFYTVGGGQILIDGRDVRDWPLEQLRAGIGYVEQDAPALAGTLRDNLTLGLGSVPDAELHRVLAMARLTGFVETLGGLEGEIGYRGGTVSGGERQRMAIARALLRRPRLLLLDEATSQLDAANERALQESIEAISDTTTVIVVAHRLSTVVGARRIVVMNEGRVHSCGTHAQLLAEDPFYRGLAATQLLTGEPPAAAAWPGQVAGTPLVAERDVNV